MEQTTDWPSVLMSLLILGIGSLGIFSLLQKAKRSLHTTVFLPEHDLPAYTQIQDDSYFYPVRITEQQVSSDMVLDPKELIGAYLVEPIKANTVIRKSHLVVPPSEMLAYPTRVVSLQVPPATAWHGEIAPGELVSIGRPSQSLSENEMARVILPKALVLKAQVVEPVETEFNGPTFFVTLVIPDGHFREIVLSALSETIMFMPIQR